MLLAKIFCHLYKSLFECRANFPKAAANPLQKQVYWSVSVMCSRLIHSCLPSDNPLAEDKRQTAEFAPA